VAVSGPTPSPKLRQLETSLNAAFDTYREMYFEGGISSVYLWDLDDEPSGKETSFAGVVLMKKSESAHPCRRCYIHAAYQW
jgi:capping protein beta